jgi:uncharacterized protein (TIGR02391 family)
MLSLPAPTSDEMSRERLFGYFIVEPEIVDVARDLFVSGFCSQAVNEAMKALDKLVQQKSDCPTLSGTSLMNTVFSEAKPRLVLSERSTTSEKDQHSGYHRIFSGSMLGIRNPCAHEHNWIDDVEEALECIVLAQHLVRKVKASSTMVEDVAQDVA